MSGVLVPIVLGFLIAVPFVIPFYGEFGNDRIIA